MIHFIIENYFANFLGVFRIILTVTLSFAVNTNAEDEMLIDGHGIRVEIGEIIDSANSLKLNIEVSPEARGLIREYNSEPFDYADRWALLSKEDRSQILEAVGRCWRWYDHFVHDGNYKPSDLAAPKTKIKSERNFAQQPHIYEGICEDGYYIEYRPPSSLYSWKNWWCRTGREFKAANGEIVKVKLEFGKDGPNTGSIWLGDDQLITAKTGSETLDGEILRRCERSPLRVTTEGNSFQTNYLRLRMLCGNRWAEALSICNSSKDIAKFSIRYEISPHANVKAIESLKLGMASRREKEVTQLESEKQRRSSTFSLSAESGAEMSIHVPQKVSAGIKAGFERTSSWEKSWEKSERNATLREHSSEVAIPLPKFKNLPERNPYLFALGLFGALKPLSYFVVDNDEKSLLPIKLLLSEAEVNISLPNTN